MKEFVEKMLKTFKCEELRTELIAVSDVINIVNKLSEEYSVSAKNAHTGGWIPCSERLPNKDMWCWATFESGNVDKIQYLASQKWWNGEMANNKVIAWQPLPEPYQPKGE